MSLNRQVYLYSIATDSFYDKKESRIHRKLLRLYKLRKKIKKTKDKEKYKKINSIIKKYKTQLTDELNSKRDTDIVRELQIDSLKDKNIISLFESALTRLLEIKQNELTYELIVVNVFFFQIFENIVKNGFRLNGNDYIFLTASAGQIRTKKAVFIKRESYEKVSNKLMCGLSVEDINARGGINPNKYLAYLALSNSATDVWEEFDIDKAIVIDDFETLVSGQVDYIDEITYEITRKQMDVLITHTDGCGMMLNGHTRMVRLPWIKGLMVQFPFDQFIQEKCGRDVRIYDIYGDPHDILAEGIEYIFTKSQFKLYKYFNNFECYKERFKYNQCEACYCNIEEEYIPKARINYQMLQTLSDMKDREIDKLIQNSIKEIDNIGIDYKTTMRLLGATDYNKNPSYFQEALMIYPELFRDPYCRDILKQTKKSLVKQAKGGRLRVNGKYLFLSPDLYAFCEWLFLGNQNPKGLLQNGEVYTKEFKNEDELACLRSPHLYREWPIRKNVRHEEIDKWFGMTKCVYVSSHDLISKIVQADWDGDRLLVIKDKLLTKVAKRNMQNIVPLAYDLKKAKAEQLTSESMYQGMIHAYTGGNIGPISNNITKVWNSDDIGEEQRKVVAWLTFYNNAVIDYAKTLWLPTPPKEIKEIISSYTKAKVPNFFIYAKDKEPYQVEELNQSVMNRIANKIPSSVLKFSKSISKFDYRMLMNIDVEFNISPNNIIIKSYDYWNARRNLFNSENENIKDQDLYCFKKMRDKIIEETRCDIDHIVNTLVAVLYTTRKQSSKKALWACFGDVILENIKRNLSNSNTKICQVCGKRFVPLTNNQICCNIECGHHLKLYKMRQKYKNSEIKN